jgi:hypothetical protein
MTMKAILVGLALAACSGKQGSTGTGSGTGSGHTTPPPGGCEGMRPKVEQLYRAEAQAKEPTRVDDAVADNTRMVMLECATAPDKVSACLAGAATVKDLETTCLAPLDDEGSETESFRN